MKLSLTKVSPFVVLTTLGLTTARCANDAQFQSESGKKIESKAGNDAVASDPKKSTIDDGGQKVPVDTLKQSPVTVSEGVEVLAPKVPSETTSVDISNGVEVPVSKAPNPQSLRTEFPASKKLSGTLTYDALEKSFSTSVELKNQYSDEKVNFTQTKRPTITDQFKQGNPGIPKTEIFNQKQLGVVDIQVVIDNSGSMAEEQDKVKTKLPDLLKFIGDSNWQINVATTDSRFFDGTGKAVTTGGQRQCSQEGVIKKGEADAMTRFSKAISAGLSGHGAEKGIMMAVEGLRCPQANNWVRPGSKVVVLIVSDEDNCSKFGDTTSAGCNGAPEEVHTYLTNFLATTLNRPLITHSRIYGIYKKPGDTTCTTAANEAVTYQKAVLATRDPMNPGTGFEGSICDGDTGYTGTFQSISKDIAVLLDTSFSLATTPDLNSMVISVDTVVVPMLNGSGEPNWELDPVGRRLIKFVKYTPPAGSEIKVTYTAGATTPLVKEFKLSNTPTNDPTAEFVVYLNGVTAKPTLDYVYDASNNSVKFLKDPEADASIKVVYRKAMNLSTSFKLPKPVAEGFVPKVTVDGKSELLFAYNKSTYEINFSTAPADSAAIEVLYKSLIGPVTVYDINLVGTTIKNVSINYAKNNAPVPGAKIEKSTLIVSEIGFISGEKINVKYFNETSGVASIKLPKIPLADSFTVSATEGSCNYVLSASRDEVSLDCSALGAKTVTMQWSYMSESETRFSLPLVLRPEVGTWTVEIDGKPTTEFKREDKTIILNAPPLQTSVITVVYMEGA